MGFNFHIIAMWGLRDIMLYDYIRSLRMSSSFSHPYSGPPSMVYMCLSVIVHFNCKWPSHSPLPIMCGKMCHDCQQNDRKCLGKLLTATEHQCLWVLTPCSNTEGYCWFHLFQLNLHSKFDCKHPSFSVPHLRICFQISHGSILIA